LDGHPFITEDSIVDYAKSERKPGRPIKICREAEEVGTGSWKAVKALLEASLRVQGKVSHNVSCVQTVVYKAQTIA